MPRVGLAFYTRNPMVAEPWWNPDHDDSDRRGVLDNRYAGLAAAPPHTALALDFFERFAAARPPWHADAACRRHSDVSWLDPDQTDAARAVCLSCPVSAECRDAGSTERWGVWGGRVKGWARTAPHSSGPGALGRTGRDVLQQCDSATLAS